MSRRRRSNFSFTWTLREHGWALCAVTDDEARAEVAVSSVTSGPEQLLAAVTQLVLGAVASRAEFEAEPTVYRWFFQRKETDVGIRLLEAADRRMPDDAGELIWCGRQTVTTLARTIVRAFDSVVDELGQVGYESRWGRPFPARELAALRAAWRTGRSLPAVVTDHAT